MTALDLFAGTGWGVACQRLGIDEHGVENMPEAIATRAAAGMRTVCHDVWDMDAGVGYEGHIASPPCQTFSLGGSREGSRHLDAVLQLIHSGDFASKDRLRAAGVTFGDERTALVLVPLYFAFHSMPNWIAWEQVPAVLPVWRAAEQVLKDVGYSTWTGLLHAEQYGVPQTRTRAFLIARLGRQFVRPPAPTHSRFYSREPDRLDPDVKRWVSMYDALGWGLTARPSPTVTGGGTYTGGAEPIGHLKRYTGRPDWVGRVDTGRIVPPIGYKLDNVRVTVAEAGVLQSYPAHFPWQGTKGKQFLQAGNAVPPLLGESVLRVATALDAA